MALSTITNGMSGATARSYINAAFAQIDANVTALNGKSATISRPKEIYVTTDGNNATAQVGNPAKPYLTVAAAAAAGEATAQSYVIILGAGSFTATRLGFSGYRTCFIGQGPQTILTLNNASSPAQESPIAVNESVFNLTISVSTDGYTALGEFETALDAAAITLTGFGWAGNISARGGAAYPASGGNAGNGNIITMQGCFICIGTITAEESANGYGSFGNAGQFIGDGCDLRSAVVNVNTTGSITIGRCSYVSGFSSSFSGTLNDKGGNALW